MGLYRVYPRVKPYVARSHGVLTSKRCNPSGVLDGVLSRPTPC
jgi:hypothetical protein